MRRNEEKDNKEIPPKLDVGANKNCEKCRVAVEFICGVPGDRYVSKRVSAAG